VKKLLLLAASVLTVWALMTGPAVALVPWLREQHLSGLITPLVLALLLLGWLLTAFLVPNQKRPRSR